MLHKYYFKLAIIIITSLLCCNTFAQTEERANLDASFLASSYEITAGQCIYFTDRSSGNPTAWFWTFEGAETPTSTDQHPTNICYYTPGVYSVVLEVQNSVAVNSEVVEACITVTENTTTPIANFTANYTTIPVNSVVQFTSTSQNGPFASYNWVFHGGMPQGSTEEVPPAVTYTEVGTYTVELTVVDENGNSDVKVRTEYINVVPEATTAPVANFIGERIFIEPGQAVNFRDLSEGTPYIWQWFFEGATPTSSTVQNPSGIVYPMPGTYDVELIIESNMGIDTLRRENYIVVSETDPCVAIPQADFIASKRLIKAGTSIYFEDKSTNGPTNWSWRFEGGYPYEAATANVVSGVQYNGIGFFDVFHSVSNECGVTSVNKEDYILVFSGPVDYYCDTISNILPNEIVCSPSAGTWGYIGGHNSQKIRTYAELFKNYSYETISSIIVPVAHSDADSYGSYVTFYIWDGSTAYPDSVLAQKKVYIRNIPENFNYVVEFNNPVKINGPFFVGYKLNYSGNDQFAVSIAPNRGASGQNTLYVETSGSGWSTAYEKFGIKTASAIRPVGCLVDIEKVEFDNNVDVYPNPASDRVYVNLGEINNDNITIDIYDMLGRKIHSQRCDGQETEINVSAYSEGLYFVTMNINDKIITRKFIVTK